MDFIYVKKRENNINNLKAEFQSDGGTMGKNHASP